MNKIIKRPESIAMHQLTENGVEKFMEVIGLLRQHIDEQKNLYNIKPGNIDARILQLLRELPKINSGESKKIKNAPSLNLTYVHPTRFELSRYIFKSLNEFIQNNNLEDNVGFWSWLALVYFEDLTDSFKNVSTEVNYIPEMGDIKLSSKKKKIYEDETEEETDDAIARSNSSTDACFTHALFHHNTFSSEPIPIPVADLQLRYDTPRVVY